MSARARLVHKRICTSLLLCHLCQLEEAMSKEPAFALLSVIASTSGGISSKPCTHHGLDLAFTIDLCITRFFLQNTAGYEWEYSQRVTAWLIQELNSKDPMVSPYHISIISLHFPIMGKSARTTKQAKASSLDGVNQQWTSWRRIELHWYNLNLSSTHLFSLILTIYFWAHSANITATLLKISAPGLALIRTPTGCLLKLLTVRFKVQISHRTESISPNCSH